MKESMQFPRREPVGRFELALRAAILRRIFDSSWTEMYPGWELPDWPLHPSHPPRIDREAMADPIRRALATHYEDKR